MFKCKTKGNVSPQGKRRVYFTCHPDDYDRFFEKISSEILKFSDCAIWYNPDDNYEDIDTDLGQMNLFVIPITTKLLTKPCRTIELDVPFALKKHIPILPLMQEMSLDELFTRKFGDLQYLDPNAHDITAISYEDKLKKYLNSVLVSDEMAEKVRAAFDAYIFLSYRKKDRKYANELMRLIHKNDFCRDIAIWYDEYLVPGEDFNNAITEALKKSDIFTMVVTPNLVNETNYVQTKEYPEAVKQNKTIIPTELEKTDHKALSEKFPEIPNCVDAHDKIALSDVLHSSLLQIAKRENDNDPQHNFFIGLAYLEGIDVEVNHERALQLITSAAETNEVPEAIEKLVTMYQDGYGVERDYRVAVEWQQRLVDYWEKEYEISYSVECRQKLFVALMQLNFLFGCLHNLNSARNTLNRLEQLLSYVDVSTFENQKNLSMIYFCQGNVLLGLGNLNDAEELYLKTLSINKLLAKTTDSVDIQIILHCTYLSLGHIQKQKGNLNYAEYLYLKALQVIEQLAKTTDSIDVQNCLPTTYLDLGDIQSDRDTADELYHKALQVSEQLAKTTDSENVQNNLLFAYSSLGDIQSDRGELDTAEELFFKALQVSEQLPTDPVAIQIILLDIYQRLGIIQKAKGNLNGAEELFLKALQVSEQLSKTTDFVDVQNDLLLTYLNLGHIQSDRGELDSAEELYHKALQVSEQLAKTTDSVSIQKKLFTTYVKLGDIQSTQGKIDSAEELYHKALQVNEQLVKTTDSVDVQNNLLAAYLRLGEIKKAKGNLNCAEELFLKALQISEQLSKTTDPVKFRSIFSIIYTRLADIQLTQEHLDSAEEFYFKALEVNELLVEDSPNIKTYETLAISYYKVALIREPYHWYYLEKSLQIFTELANQYPTNEYFSQLRDIIKNIFEQKQ